MPNEEQKRGQGLRYNTGKLRYDLIHPLAEKGLVDVLTYGANKYSEKNWCAGMKWSTVIASAKRHLAALERGEDFDPETSRLHVDHLQCNAHFLSAYYSIYPEGDDRDHKYLRVPRIALDIDDVLGNFVGSWCSYFKQDIAKFWFFDWKFDSRFKEALQNKEFWTNMEMLTTPEEIPFEPVCYITSRTTNPEWTIEWLSKNNYPAVPVYYANKEHTKEQIAKENNIQWMVDDRFDNFVNLNNNGVCCFLFDRPHNQRFNVGHKRIKSLQELFDKI